VTRTFIAEPVLPPGRPRLVVTGFMGAGKTTAGRAAARLLGLPFIDLDEVIERRTGLPLNAIFERDGETGFRSLERVVVAEAARLSGAVVATGGGAVLDATSFAALAQGSVVSVLTAEPLELIRRIRGSAGRPLLDHGAEPGARALELLSQRAPAYEAAGEPLDTTQLDEVAVASELAGRFRGAGRDPLGRVRLDVHGPDSPYPVVIGEGSLDALGSEVRTALPRSVLAALVVDAGALGPAADRAAASLGAAGLKVERIAAAGGEGSKSLETVTRLWDRFAGVGLSLTDAVVVMGGGATLDAVGFAAATFARGVPLVNVPTTLLAMVDASVGGKVGVDRGPVKNLVGAFHHPRLVVADPATLASLPPRSLRGGMAEVVKAFVVGGVLGLDVMESMALEDPGGIPGTADLVWLIEQAVRIKAAYVSADPSDLGPRHALNLGHTFAHAIEAASDHAVPHGEAVAVGLVAAARLGAIAGPTDPALGDRLEVLLTRLGLPTRLPEGLDTDRMLDAMAVDKKRRAARSVFVVPAPGGVELLEIDPREALTAMSEPATP
jgi:shikimate kinase / 3-dehydroquinate synthase